VKYLYFRKWYSVMQVLGADGRHLGYYVDIDTPIHRVGNEVYLTDLFLDLWIAPDGSFIELDRQELEEGFQSKLITSYQVRKANQTLKMIVREIASGDFFNIIY
jgi:predicted RNA-binding protein associated with RNAse of E/G family